MARRQQQSKVTVHNYSGLTLEDIESLTPLGVRDSMGRRRTITLYQHPTEAGMIISSGLFFDRTVRVISVEPWQVWAAALACIARGKVYIDH